MKKLKKMMAVLLAGVMTMAMAVTASAASETGNGSIQIDGTKAKGNVEAYRMFSAVVEQKGTSADQDSVKYTLERGFEDFFKTTYPEMNTLTETALSDAAAEKLDQIQRGDVTGKVEFSKKVLDWVLKAENAVKVADLKYTQAAGEGSTTITGLPFGFYMVCTPEARQEATSGNEKTPAMMVTVKDTTPVQVTLKSEYPTVDKTIVPGIDDPDDVTPGSGSVDVTINDNWDTIHGMELESIATGGNAGDFQVGDVVTFKLTAKVPDMTGFTDYTFKFHDTLSAGLTFQAIQKVTVGTTAIKPVQESAPVNNAYSVKLNGQQLTITMNNFLQSYKNMVGQEITVYYKAVVNKDAVIGMNPNTNEAQVEFSNNPNTETTDKSEPDVVNVHTFGFDIFKFVQESKNEKPLAGAEFGLYQDKGTTQKIKLTKQLDKEIWIVSTDSTTDNNIVTPGDGKVTVKGLKAGTYYLKEIKAPDGYHMLKSPIKIDIKANYDTQSGKLASYDVNYTYEGKTVEQNVTAGNNTATVKVENKNGSILPNTGGMGTVLFTVVSVVLILGVAVSFVMSRRKEDK